MKNKTKKILFNCFVGLLIIVGLCWICSKFIHLGDVEYTDNAQIRQHIVPINSRIQGFITKIYFTEFQAIHKGDTLMLVENTEFKLRVAQAEADYQNAVIAKSAMGTTINTTQNNIAVSDAAIEEVKIMRNNAESEYHRYKNLLDNGAVTKQQYDVIKTQYDALNAKYEMLTRQKHSTSLIKTEQTQRIQQNEAGIAVAEAALELAKLNLSYTVIIAPCDGYTSRKNIQEGQLIQPGQTVVDIIEANNIWVIANYKETQTANISEGLSVNIEADGVPGVVFNGIVKSISHATGANLSLMPQDNSAGNFIKVEQRIPVRIEFTKDNSDEDIQKLRSGMNVECTVNY